jgi:hypothetical protein
MQLAVREEKKYTKVDHGFLLDRDVAKAKDLFPAKRTKTMEDVGLPPDAPDSELVFEAWNRKLILVTGNGKDFKREIEHFLRGTKRKLCHEVYGLLVLPNGYERQKRFVRTIESKLRLGKDRLTWADVFDRNLHVQVDRSGAVSVREFPRCAYCLKLQEN